MENTLNNHHYGSLNLQQSGIINAKDITPGTMLVCEQGTIWLTQLNDIKDYLLKTGETMVVDKKSSFLIQALSNACLSVLHNN